MKALTPNSKAASKLIHEECDRRIDQASQWMIACMTMVLLDKAHIDPDEIQTIIKEIEKLFSSITAGYLDFNDVIKPCRMITASICTLYRKNQNYKISLPPGTIK